MKKMCGVFVCLAFAAIALFLESCEGKAIDEIIKDASMSNRFLDRHTSRTSEREVLVELDMRLKQHQWQRIVHGTRKNRKALRHLYSRWEYAQIFYRIGDPSFSQDDVRVILEAVGEWEKFTCLKFTPYSGRDRHYIDFVDLDGDGCWSYVGLKGGPQPIELNNGCRTKGAVLHEIGHALGFFHEQSRPDRDDHVTVMTANIQDGYQDNFLKLDNKDVDTYGVPYDYLSVMHYGKNFLSKNGSPTIVTKNPAYQNVIGNREGVSLRDLQLANLMYDCHICGPDEYLCESNLCITSNKLCDGRQDCFGGDDERNCSSVKLMRIPADDTAKARPVTIRPTISLNVKTAGSSGSVSNAGGVSSWGLIVLTRIFAGVRAM